MTKMKKLTSVVLAMFMSFSLLTFAFAYEKTDEENIENLFIPVLGNSYQGDISFFNRINTEEISGSGALENINFTTDNNAVVVSMSFTNNNGEQSDLSFTGTLYPSGSTSQSNENLIMGNFSPCGDYVLTYYRVEKACSHISPVTGSEDIFGKNMVMLVLYDGTNDEYYTFEYEISDQLFSIYCDSAYAICSEMTSEQIANNFINSVSIAKPSMSTYATTATSIAYNSDSTSNTGISMTRDLLNSILESINTNGSSSYTDSSASGTFLKQSGFKVYQNLSSLVPYMYVAYGEDNGVSNIIYVDLCQFSQTKTSATAKARMSIQNAAVIEYYYAASGSSKTAQRLSQYRGLKLSAPGVAIGNIDGTNTFFTNASSSYNMYSGTSLKAILYSVITAKYPYTSVWDALQCSKTASAWNTTFELTAANQQSTYGGLVKDIGTTSGTGSYLYESGDYLAIQGDISGSFSQFNSAYKFTAKL